jgi:hypothetical protein
MRQAAGSTLYVTGPHVFHPSEGSTMITTKNMKKMAGMAMLSGSLGLAALGLGAGTAQADSGPFHWCPGDPMQYPQPAPHSGDQAGPGVYYNWDMNVCHTWYWVAHEKGNVPYQGSLPSGVWDGDNPPPLEPNRCDFCW